ncbi:MAG: hypothetical protein O9341_11645, partial [Paucibacter sp.]|nr:hypothetical protein [Roseateles sp.]
MIDRWLNPEHDDPNDGLESYVQTLDEASLHEFGVGLLGESLVAQRVLLARRSGLELRASLPGQLDLSYWGHSFASAVAVLMPPQAGQEAGQRRKRRKRQEQLLNGQDAWPDLATVKNAAYLLCADSYPPEVGLPRKLYPNRQETATLLNYEGFDQLLQLLTSTVSPSLGPAWLKGKPWLREALSTIVLETFKNTHDHARREVDHSNVRDSVRGLYARYYGMDELVKFAKIGDPDLHSPALRYARNFIAREERPGVRIESTPTVSGLLELSVLDSGPGMAAKFLGKDVGDVPVRDQLSAVMACFEKGRTTTGTKGRGFGLAKVLLNLKVLHGFMSVRTNSVHIFRQFASLRGAASIEESDGAQMPD